MFRPTLIIMVKEPRPGRVKTRLARGVGTVGAAWWYRHQTARLIARLTDPRWHLVLAVSPDAVGLRSRVWPLGVPRVAQGSGSLGDRMGRLLRSAMGPVCIIGSDIPDITAREVAYAFGKLGGNDAVFGPSEDGGFWLIGLRRSRAVPAGIFGGVRWSTSHALADSAATLPGFRIGLAQTLRDVDTLEDLRMTRGGTRVSSAP